MLFDHQIGTITDIYCGEIPLIYLDFGSLQVLKQVSVFLAWWEIVSLILFLVVLSSTGYLFSCARIRKSVVSPTKCSIVRNFWEILRFWSLFDASRQLTDFSRTWDGGCFLRGFSWVLHDSFSYAFVSLELHEEVKVNYFLSCRFDSF